MAGEPDVGSPTSSVEIVSSCGGEAYPVMKEAAEFELGTLVEAPAGTPVAGRLVTNPSTSPENRYVLNGKPRSDLRAHDGH